MSKQSFFGAFLLFSTISVSACMSSAPTPSFTQSGSVQSNSASDTSSSSISLSSSQTISSDQQDIEQKADTLLRALKAKDMQTIAQLASIKGVTFSPYAYVSSDDLTFTPPQLVRFFTDTKKYVWGSYDGSGLPIELTPMEYFDKFVYDHDFASQNDKRFDATDSQGNTLNTIAEAYPQTHSVNFHYTPSRNENEMDWADLWLVFEKEENEWMLRAVVHDEWTI
ncbi:MAG: hypothetical protein KBD00_01180 [Candidatus Peribacteraceae bacterium]|nr:hypothetical protein [Candidatus Peribacteraceae bacterium]